MLTPLFKARRSVSRAKNKGQSMAQRINVLQYNRLVLRQWSPLLLGKTEPICIEFCLMASRLANKDLVYSIRF